MPDDNRHFMSLETLLRYLSEGRFEVPGYQRPFDWAPAAIKQFLDPLVASFTLSDSLDKELVLLKAQPTDFSAISCQPIAGYTGNRERREYIVLDGHNELTALYRAFMNSGEPIQNERMLYFLDAKSEEEVEDDWHQNIYFLQDLKIKLAELESQLQEAETFDTAQALEQDIDDCRTQVLEEEKSLQKGWSFLTTRSETAVSASDIRQQGALGLIPLHVIGKGEEDFKAWFVEWNKVSPDHIMRKDYIDVEVTRILQRKIWYTAIGMTERDQIQEIEIALRACIAAELGDDVSLLPSDPRLQADKRIEDAIKADPTLDQDHTKTLAGKIEHFDLRGLQQVITNKKLWARFEAEFKSKEELNRRFDQLAGLRNPISHSRPLGKVSQKDGEAAILWFRAVLNLED